MTDETHNQTPPPSSHVDGWRYAIQYGPEGEANYAWLYCGKDMVATMRTYHAMEICAAMNALSAGGANNE